MLILNPSQVRFGQTPWPGVTSVAISREAARLVEAYGDGSPHARFVDAPEERVEVEVRQSLDSASGDSPANLAVGTEDDLAFERSWSGTDAGREAITVRAVVLADRIVLGEGGGRAPRAVRLVRLRAVSPDGADPVAIEPLDGGAA